MNLERLIPRVGYRARPAGFLLIVLIVVVALAAIIGVHLRGREAGETLQIALVRPMGNGGTDPRGENMERGCRLLLDELNERGGINGKRVELAVFGDEGDPTLTSKLAERIADETNALVVLGHLDSDTSLAAGEIYKRHGLPAISGSATADRLTQNNEWYFRVVFNNRSQSIFLAHYVKRILKQDRVSIIFSGDSYGLGLVPYFEKTFRGLGGGIANKWQIGTPRLVDLVAAAEDPGMIFLAAGASEAEELIVAMRRKGNTDPMIGADAIGNQGFANRFKKYPEEQIYPGIFTDGIHATSPMIFDVATREARGFADSFILKYGADPTWEAATYYDAALAATEAIRVAGAGLERADLAEHRRGIRDALSGLEGGQESTTGVGGTLVFDQLGDVVRPIQMGTFSHQRFISALTQLRRVPDLNRILDLEGNLERGAILIVDGKYLHRTDVVYTGLDFIAVSDLDTKSSSYNMDVYLWFRSRKDVVIEDIKFINAVGELDVGEPIKKLDTGDAKYVAYRLKARFSAEFRFNSYPFDKQRLALSFRHADLTRENLIFVADTIGMSHTDAASSLAKLQRTDALGAIGTWSASGANVFQDIMTTESTLGNPQLFRAGADTEYEYSRFNATIEIKRDVRSFVVKNLFPLAVIAFLSCLVFFMRGASDQIATAIACLLTVTFFHLNVSDELPGIGYTVALDYVFYALDVLIVVQILVLSFVHSLQARKGDGKAGRRILAAGRVGYPLIMVILAIRFFSGHGLIAWPTFRDTSVQAVQAVTGDVGVADGGPADSEEGEVTLRLGSWRVDDEEEMEEILSGFTERHPGINVRFDASSYSADDQLLRFQFEKGIAPDLFYLEAFSHSQYLIDNGFVEPVARVPPAAGSEEADADPLGLRERFGPKILEYWSTKDGVVYGVPMMAVLHGIYYNVDLFQRFGLRVPETWEELLAGAAELRRRGIVPFANGSGTEWAVAEVLFMNVAPNFIGGRPGRQEYLEGKRCFDDERVVSAFQAVADLAPFMPDDHGSVTDYDSRRIFLQGEAAMWFSGSWEITSLKEGAPGFRWSVFAVPAPAGSRSFVTVHPDFAIGLNADSRHKEEARKFLRWATTSEAATLFAEKLSGFVPLQEGSWSPSDEHVRAFLALTEGRGRDVRWSWPKLMDSLPSGYTLMQDGALAVLSGKMSAREAANSLQSGLGQWFEGAQECMPRFGRPRGDAARVPD